MQIKPLQTLCLRQCFLASLAYDDFWLIGRFGMLWSALEVNFVIEMLLKRGLLRDFDECLNPNCLAWSAAL